MKSLRRSPAADPTEDDDLLWEILLRLPPQPSSLPRASLVCKRWRRLVSDSVFFRRFQLHHRRNPPLLGLFDRCQCLPFVPALEAPNRVPPWRFSLQTEDDVGCPTSLGCRHGLVLLHLPKSLQVLVWDPFTGDQHRIALPPRFCAKGTMINGAVLRTTGHVHFQVVLVTADDGGSHRLAFACVYSSHTGRWGDLVSTPIPSEPEVHLDFLSPTVVNPQAAVLVGNSLHWLLFGCNFAGILDFDLDRHRLAVTQVPLDILAQGDDVAITRTEWGGLGFILLSDFSAHLWNREHDCNGVASWVLRRTIDLDKLLSLNLEEERDPLTIIGFAESSNVVLLWTGSLFMVQLESLQFKKLSETNMVACSPFESVYAASNSMP
ncbi:hypothetical protein QYE76_019728 [Lolium multiflorum]|uniref:F-box domain-containing protein n=1 Tax=Lolium multiflorum TaxID=4521 RepID=A0AAD8VQN9_LOLMU|nr:hypothetical protein QYE76_019728 [Lolium multiflorum]